MTPLGLLSPGETGEIAEIRIRVNPSSCSCREGDVDCECAGPCECGGSSRRSEESARLEGLGLRVGKSVEMLSNNSGPVLLRVDESRIAIARGMAMKIMVRREK